MLAGLVYFLYLAVIAAVMDRIIPRTPGDQDV